MRTWKQSAFTVPGIGVALLPKLICPLCWPLYAGIVSSVGLGFLIGTAYLLPITAALGFELIDDKAMARSSPASSLQRQF